MGLTSQSTWFGALKEDFAVEAPCPDDIVVGLAGNPNTGKSTVFNALTGLNQHTGNWPGKTVANARGNYAYKNKKFVLIDLPGTYSLLSNSVEEEVARDFICFAKPRATVVVTDATCIERNLNLVLQILEITDNVVVCVNLLDEAKRKGIELDLKQLSNILGVPVVGTNARDGIGLDELKAAVLKVATGEIKNKPFKVKYDESIEKAVMTLNPCLEHIPEDKINKRWLALRLIEGDDVILNSLERYLDIGTLKNEMVMRNLNLIRKSFNENSVDSDLLRDKIVSAIVHSAEAIGNKIVTLKKENYNEFDRKIDDILTSKTFGIPIMLALLGLVFWITITGANYPSELLAKGLFYIEGRLTDFFILANLPKWLHGVLVLGIYRTLAWVISVMLPPMAIFFPLFTLLEDLGYLPRVAFNLDNFFKKACAHGKQALTMCMGFGCNAAGIIACRIIDSPRERLIAIITNNFVPCNGRFPTLITLSTIFIAGSFGVFSSVVATLTLVAAIVLAVIITLAISKLLSKTILKGLPSSFTLELPPYRVPQFGKILVRSIFDRTIFVLSRAIVVAAPAGLLIWLMANVNIGSATILDLGARTLQPLGYLLGMDGYILMAFILGLPANEIVIPIIIMSYTATGSLLELGSIGALRDLLVANGWTWLTAVCTMLFSLNHFPCGTTLLTIYKETQSKKWTLLSFVIPTLTGIAICFIVAQTARFLGLA